MDIFDHTTSLEEYMVAMATANKTPIGGSIELLPLCNMNCGMCYVRLSKNEMEQQGQLRSVDEWMALADEMKDAGVLFLLLTGGEPLLYPGFQELYLYLKKIGMIVTINTNGTLLDEEWADFFSKNPPRRMNVTLYGASEHTYKELCQYPSGYERTVRGIKLLYDKGIDIKINGSLVKKNEKDADKIMDFADSMGIFSNIDTYMYPACRERNGMFDKNIRLTPREAAKEKLHFLKRKMTPEEFNKRADDIISIVANTLPGEAKQEEIKCRAGKSSFTINWQGKMRPCVMLNNPEIDVFQIGFQTAWEYTVKETNKIRLSAKCSECTLRNVCQTCAACALLESGEYDGIPEYMCEYTKAEIEYLKDYSYNLG